MRTISRILLIATALASCCMPLTKAATDEEHVVKDISKFPYMAMIKFNNTVNCSAAIINDHHVLTAAHCVNISGVVDLKKLEILVGGLNSTANTTKSFKVDKLFIHAKFSNASFDNDIAIVKVIGNLTSVNGTKAIALWNNNAEHTTNCTLAGWSRWKDLNITYNETLLTTREQILNEDACKREYPNYSPDKYCALDDYSICTRGGPLVCKNVVWGIASQPSPCLSGMYITLFTRLSTYSAWINDTLKTSGISTHLPSTYLIGITFVTFYLFNSSN